MGWLNLGSLAGFVVLSGLAWATGGFRRPFPGRTVGGAGALMLALGVVVFWIPPTRTALVWLNDLVLAVLGAGTAGAEFLLGPLAVGPGGKTATGEPSVGFVLAAQVLPAVIFFSAIMAALYHLRVIQPVVRLFAKVFHRAVGLSGAESLAGAANIFVGVESAMTVRPYLETMTRSELLTLLSCGMATVASTTLAIYASFLIGSFPQIAGHIISASVLSIPAAAMASKLILPETDTPVTMGSVPPTDESKREANVMAALISGSFDGLKLAAGIAALLIAVLGIVAMIDLALGHLGPDLSTILGWIFTPLAWLLGIESGDLRGAAQLLGDRAILTEIVAYQRLAEMAASGSVSQRTLLVLSYALCGFAHVASVGIFVGGFAALAPGRRGDLAALGPRAFAAATIATLMTGALAGFFYHGQRGVLGL